MRLLVALSLGSALFAAPALAGSSQGGFAGVIGGANSFGVAALSQTQTVTKVAPVITGPTTVTTVAPSINVHPKLQNSTQELTGVVIGTGTSSITGLSAQE